MKKKLFLICLSLVFTAAILYWFKVPHIFIGQYLSPSDNLSQVVYKRDCVFSGHENIILVTSPYHQRRVYETFKKVFRGSGIQLQNSPSIYSSWKPNDWWNAERESHLTQEESIKVL